MRPRGQARGAVGIVTAVLVCAAACTSSPGTPGAAPGGPGSVVTPPAGGAAGGTTTSAVVFTPDHLLVEVDYPPQPEGVPWPTTAFPEGPLPPQVDAARVDSILDDAFGPGSTGLNHQYDAVVIVHAGRIVSERYREGWGGKETIHRSWSMAKSFTQALTGILVRQGRLDVRAPAPVPQWSDASDPRHEITTDQMLRMASGLAWIEDYFAPDSDTIAMLGGTGKADMAAYAASKPLEVEPGSRVRYSTGTTCIVSGVIGSIVGHGEAYRTFIAHELLDPLGISSSEATPGFDGAGNLIGGSVFDATARSFAKFGLLYLRGGVWDGRRILPEGWVDYARTPTPPPEGTERYGAGWWVVPKEPGRFEAGGFGGQHITVVPSKDLVVVLLSDRVDGAEGEVRDDLIDAFDAVPDVTSARTVGSVPPPA